MRLYIANPTRQNHVIMYRLGIDKTGAALPPGKFTPAKSQDLPAGRQIQLGSDFVMPQIDDIVEQLRVYGLVGTADVGRLPNRVVPYVFNVDQPVPADVMRAVLAHNKTIQSEDGRQRRAKAAVASHELVQNTVAQQFAAQGIDQDPSTRTSISIEQEERSEDGEKLLAEGFRVDASAPLPPKGSGKGGRRGARTN